MSGIKQKNPSQDFGNYTLWDFILGKQSLLWQPKQVLSSHAIKARDFPCLHTPVRSWGKRAERVVRLTHRHDQTLLLPPATDVTFFPAWATGLSLTQPAISDEALDSKGTFRARVTLLNRPKQSLRGTRHVSIAHQSCCRCSRSCSALRVGRKWREKMRSCRKEKKKKNKKTQHCTRIAPSVLLTRNISLCPENL